MANETMWPREPDIAVIKNLARQHLSPEIAGVIEQNKLEITQFTYRAFNRLYLVSYSGHEAKYLFRVTLSVIPFFKTESEVATLAYLRTNTSIPVPRAIAWSSSSDNDLGFEWILMNKVAGVELRSVWRQIPWQRKLELVDEVAGFVHQLQTHPFNAVGSLYFKSALVAHQSGDNHAATELLSDEPLQESEMEGPVKFVEIKGNMIATSATTALLKPENQTANDENHEQNLPQETTKAKGQKTASESPQAKAEEQFVIGPLFSWVFWLGARLYLPGHRGPYKNSYEWLKALIEMQRTWMKAVRGDDESDYEEDFEEEAPWINKGCQQYLDILPSICPENDQTPPFMYHHDLNSANILVDPEKLAITGIVNWETINILPKWKASDYPEFLKSADPPSNSDSAISSNDDRQTHNTDTRDLWGNRMLRGRYDEAMKRLSDDYESTMSPEHRKTQRQFEEMIGDLSDNIDAAQSWLEGYKAGIEYEEKEQAEIASAHNENETGRDLEQAIPSHAASLIGEVREPIAPEEHTEAHIPTLAGVLPISAITAPEDVASTQLEVLRFEKQALSNTPKTGLAGCVCANGGGGNPGEGGMTQEPVIEKKSEDIEAKAPPAPTVPKRDEFDIPYVRPGADCVERPRSFCTVS